jgi:hypothetical protein
MMSPPKLAAEGTIGQKVEEELRKANRSSLLTIIKV